MSRAHKDCKYCGDNILSSSMSSHLKQVHAAEVAREEKQLRDHDAHWFELARTFLSICKSGAMASTPFLHSVL